MCSAVVVSGELCQFPSDHPIQILESEVAVPVEEMENNRVYIYTDQFGNCSGCVRSLRFCYKPNMNELMTIEIGNNGDGLSASHIVTVDSTNDMTNCAERYSLNHFYCCVEQMLTEPFVVGHKNWHYRLRFGNVASLLLRHQNETVAGRQEGLNGAVYKPLFYFTIDPDDGRLLNQLYYIEYKFLSQMTAPISQVPLRAALPLQQLLLRVPLRVPLKVPLRVPLRAPPQLVTCQQFLQQPPLVVL